MKTCTQCKVEKTLDEFFKDKQHKDGLHTWCKACKSARRKTWGESNREHFNAYMRRYNAEHPKSVAFKKRASERVLKCRYGISREMKREMLALQNDACALCERKDKRLVVDHEHSTGKVRGYLCHSCNRSLHILDNQQLLQKAIEYCSRGSSPNSAHGWGAMQQSSKTNLR